MDTATAEDLRFLLGTGSPLGGARPNSAVSLKDGRLAPAKFPKADDTRDIAAGEILALTFAAKADIRVAEHQLVSVGRQSVAVIARFDGPPRTHSIRLRDHTAVLPPGEPGACTLIGDTIRQFGHDVLDDLAELWRRLVFSLLVSNYDDHPGGSCNVAQNQDWLNRESERLPWPRLLMDVAAQMGAAVVGKDGLMNTAQDRKVGSFIV